MINLYIIAFNSIADSGTKKNHQTVDEIAGIVYYYNKKIKNNFISGSMVRTVGMNGDLQEVQLCPFSFDWVHGCACCGSVNPLDRRLPIGSFFI